MPGDGGIHLVTDLVLLGYSNPSMALRVECHFVSLGIANSYRWQLHPASVELQAVCIIAFHDVITIIKRYLTMRMLLELGVLGGLLVTLCSLRCIEDSNGVPRRW